MRTWSAVTLAFLFVVLGASVFHWNSAPPPEGRIVYDGNSYILEACLPVDMDSLTYTGFKVDGHRVYYGGDGTLYLQDGDGYLAYVRGNGGHAMEFSVSGCLGDRKGEEGISVEAQNGTVNIEWYLQYHCCAEMEMSALVEGGTISVHTVDHGETCRCICEYRLDANIRGLESGEYRVVIYDVLMEDEAAEGSAGLVACEQTVLIH
ncbi:MAG TPA: hypothetical protein PK718_08445 [Candidatus Methanofastidiosa archaeon]|nr:hypothetical protein [Candidatus Methanofastidiosa archaeon]